VYYYKVYTKEQIHNEIINRLFPRKSIILKNPDGFNQIFNQSFKEFLQAYVYEPRCVELPTSVNHVDLELNNSLVSTIYPGTKIGKVIMIYSATPSVDFFNTWKTRFAANPNFIINLINYNDDFKDFMFTHQLYQQIKRKLSNTNVDWNVIKYGNDTFKIILGSSFKSFIRVMVFFLPYFELETITTIDDDTDEEVTTESTSWLLTDQEYQFLIKTMHALILQREGIAISELDVTGVANNKDTLIAEGEKIMTQAMDDFTKKQASRRVGRRI